MKPSSAWIRLHQGPLHRRATVKAALLLAVIGLVLYPKPWLFVRWVDRLRDLNGVLDPAHAGLVPLAEQVRAAVPSDADTPAVLDAVERAVYARIPYAWDWDTWGVMDYLPTVDEALRAGREDCDGRAVVAASLLRHLGYEADLVTDVKHMWVVAREMTPGGPHEYEVMSPGQGGRAIQGGPQGSRVALTDAVPNLARGLAFGVAVFPLGREIVIVAAIVLLTVHPWSGPGRRVVGSGLLLLALVMMRLAGATGTGLAEHPGLFWAGVIVAVAGWTTLAVRAGVSRSPAGPPESPAGGAERLDRSPDTPARSSSRPQE